MATTNTADWMHDFRHMHNMSINLWTLPSTHDSGAYTVDFSKIPDELPSRYKNYLRFSWIPCVRNTINDWIITQSFDIYTQLLMGIRKFDLRICYHNQEFYIGHTYICIKLQEALSDIKKFLDEHPGEILILKWKPVYYLRQTITSATLQLFLNIIKDELVDFNIDDFAMLLPSYNTLIEYGNIINIYTKSYQNIEQPRFMWRNLKDKQLRNINSRDTSARPIELMDNLSQFMYSSLSFNQLNLTMPVNEELVRQNILNNIFKPWKERSSTRKLGSEMQKDFARLITEYMANEYPISSIYMDNPQPETVRQIIEKLNDDDLE